MADLATRYDAIQRRWAPDYHALNEQRFASSPLSKDYYGGAAGAQYRRQAEAYGRTLRQLRRASRRGDVRAGMAEIGLRNQALGEGFTPGGIRDRDQFNAAREEWQGGMEQRSADIARLGDISRRRAEEEMDMDYPGQTGGSDPGYPETPDPDGYYRSPDGFRIGRRLGGGVEEYGATVNPNATPGAGRGAPVRRAYEREDTGFSRSRLFGTRPY